MALASGAALGLTAWCGVGFNITTTQVSSALDCHMDYFMNFRYFHFLFLELV